MSRSGSSGSIPKRLKWCDESASMRNLARTVCYSMRARQSIALSISEGLRRIAKAGAVHRARCWRISERRFLQSILSVRGLPLDERLLDHEVTGFGVVAFGEAALLEDAAQVFEHARAAAQHETVGRDVERRKVDIVEQALRGDEVGDAAAIAERLARHRRIVDQ